MDKFDKHIRDKMNQLEVKPSAGIQNTLKSQYPKQSLLNKLALNYPVAILSVVIITALVFGIKDVMKEDTYYKQVVYETTDSLFHIELDEPEGTLIESGDPDVTIIVEDNTLCKNLNHVFSYDSLIRIPIQTNDGVNVFCDQKSVETKILENELLVKNNEDGVCNIVLRDISQNIIDSICVHFLPWPEIFNVHDTSVCGLKLVLPILVESGTWISENGLRIKDDGLSSIIQSEEFGNYILKRRVDTEFGSYFDSVYVQFIPETKLRVDILNEAICYGQSMKMRITGVDTDFVSVLSEAGKIVYKENDLFVFDFNKGFTGTAKCYIKSSTKDCEFLDSIFVYVPKKPEVICTSANCIINGSVFVDENVYPDCKISCDGVSEGLKIDDLEPGLHEVRIVSSDGCNYIENVLVENQRKIHVEFEYKMSLDGLAVQTRNLTTGVDRYDGELEFAWYVNNEYVTDEEEPILELTQINNAIRLKVNFGEYCVDEYLIKDIRPNADLIRCPNIFTPNGDGQHDEFRVIVDSRLVEFKAIIMNRAGNLVYEWTDPELGWDGRISGGEHASEGVYFYIVRAFDPDGKPMEKRGTVQLIRD